MNTKKIKVFFSLLALILLMLIIYNVGFRANFPFVEMPELLLQDEAELSKCITCSNEWRSRTNFVQVLSSVYVSVRTATKSHQTRLAPLLVTWMQTVSPDQVSIKQKIMLFFELPIKI